MSQSEKAELFRSLHVPSHPLVLVNAWDAASARVVELAGFPAVATTSSGVANALGYPDGEFVSRDEVLAVVRRITRVVSVPVSVDYVAGYGHTPDEVAESIRLLLEAGAIGLNIEDSTGDPARPLYSIEEQVTRLQAVRAAGEAAGVPIVINARTDALFTKSLPEAERLPEAIRRVQAYRAAGADCVLVLGARDAEAIRQIVQAVDSPVNVLAGPAAPPIPELAKLGVARVSIGGGAALATLGLLRQIAQELKEQGTYSKIAEYALTHAEGNAMFREG